MTTPPRGRWLTAAAIAFAALAVSNAMKPLELTPQAGFVLFGERLSGTANTIAGPLFGLFLAVYAYGLWTMRRFALPLAWIYAGYVLVNLVLFPFRTPAPPDAGPAHALFGLAYAVVALGVSVGTARVLSARRDELR